MGKSVARLQRLLAMFCISQSLIANNDYLVEQKINQMPLAFTQNQGQWDENVLFRANSGSATMWFTKEGVTYQFIRRIGKSGGMLPMPSATELDSRFRGNDKRRGNDQQSGNDMEPASAEQLVVTTKFVGATPDPEFVAGEQMEYMCNYFLGSDPSKWRTDVPIYETIVCGDIYPGIDLKYYCNSAGRLELDFVVSPGADYAQIQIQYEGTESLAVAEDGSLRMMCLWGEMQELLPQVYQEKNGLRRSLTAHYLISDDQTVGFQLEGDYDRSLAVVIDPVVVFSNTFGGSAEDVGTAIAVDGSGNTYVTGWTDSENFPTHPIFNYQMNQGARDVFVIKLNRTGDLVYGTYLGGSSDEAGAGIGVDDNNRAYMTGWTTSSDFPTLNPLQTYGGSGDVFVTKLNSMGNGLVYSTWLGGTNVDYGNGIAVHAAGGVYVTGGTYSSDYPLMNPYQTYQGISEHADAFVTHLQSDGSMAYSTYLGGNDNDEGWGIAIGVGGHAFVAGTTSSANFPTTPGSYQAEDPDVLGTDAFVTCLHGSGESLYYSTYLGGRFGDEGRSIAVSGVNAYVTGTTASDDFPTRNPYQTFQGGTYDGFVTKLGSTGQGLVYSTYLGGSDVDHGAGIAVHSSGCAWVTGYTLSDNFPTVDPSQTNQDGYDAFITKFNNNGSSPIYSTYLGGSSYDDGQGIAVDAADTAYVTGHTLSADFPIQNPSQKNRDSDNIFVTKVAARVFPSPPIPTLSEWALILFSVMLLALMTYYVIRRRQLARA